MFLSNWLDYYFEPDNRKLRHRQYDKLVVTTKLLGKPKTDFIDLLLSTGASFLGQADKMVRAYDDGTRAAGLMIEALENVGAGYVVVPVDGSHLETLTEHSMVFNINHGLVDCSTIEKLSLMFSSPYEAIHLFPDMMIHKTALNKYFTFEQDLTLLTWANQLHFEASSFWSWDSQLVSAFFNSDVFDSNLKNYANDPRRVVDETLADLGDYWYDHPSPKPQARILKLLERQPFVIDRYEGVYVDC